MTVLHREIPGMKTKVGVSFNLAKVRVSLNLATVVLASEIIDT